MSCRGGNHLTPDGGTSCHCGDVVQVAADRTQPVDGGLRQFAEWLVSLDDDDPQSPGRQDRRTVTLAAIVDRARRALAQPTCQQPHATGVGITMHCQQPAGHDGQHQDSSGGEWPATRRATLDM